MKEIDRTVRRLGWVGYVVYGIVVDSIGYYTGCEWSSEKPSLEYAQEELAKHGIAATECEVCPGEDYEAAHAKRLAAGYYDEADMHA